MGLKVRHLQPGCSVVGCREFVEERVLNLLWCSTHGEYIKLTVGERNYRDFVEGMREQGIKGEPVAQNPGGSVEDRRCAIPDCKRGIVTGADLFTPHKQPGLVWACDVHEQILQRVVRKQNGPRLLHELSLQREQKSNRERQEREKAIRSACLKYKEKVPNYIERVCEDLQKHHIKMLDSWLDRWRFKYSLRFEPHEWLDAHREKRTKPTLQRYISRMCKLRLTPNPK